MNLHRSLWFGTVTGLLLVGSASAQVALLDKAGLSARLADRPPCCVVDARGAAARQAKPINDALVYRVGLRINPTATVVVLADTDAKAMSAARALEKAYPGKPVVAVKGGLPVWQAVLVDDEAKHSVQGSTSFVIPKNTCEQDTPLQKLMRAKQ